MYMRDRSQAGELLANQLMHLRFENTAVLALSAGGVIVGEQIARRLHATLSLLVSETIAAPGDSSLILGTIDQVGDFAFNNRIPAGQMEEYLTDMRNYLEEEKLRKLYHLSLLTASDETVDTALLKDRHVILVTDGVKTGLSFAAAHEFLKPIPTESIIAAIPVGPADVIEHVREIVDEVHYLYIPDNFVSVHHYYEDNTLGDTKAIIDSINNVVSRWV